MKPTPNKPKPFLLAPAHRRQIVKLLAEYQTELEAVIDSHTVNGDPGDDAHDQRVVLIARQRWGLAERMVKLLSGKNHYAATLGRRGGLKGGRARAANMTPEQRSESARKAVKARWEKWAATRAGGRSE